MDAPWFNGDDERDRDVPPADRHWPEEPCDCHCEKCGAPLELDPYLGRFYGSCGDCYGGADPDGDAFRGGEAAAYAADQQLAAQRLK